MNSAYSEYADNGIGATLAILGIIGLPANIIAAIYFIGYADKRHITTNLYIFVSLIDCCICLSSHIPTTISLFHHRAPVWFGNATFCLLWRNMFKTLQRLCVFLVLLLSTTRTVALAMPLYILSLKTVMVIFSSFVGYLLVEAVVFIPFQSYTYDSNTTYCYEDLEHHNSTIPQYCIYSATLGIPALLIFTSFVICVYVLKKPGVIPSSSDRKAKATVTILLFTLIYMVCNLPYYINIVLWITVQFLDYDPFYSTNPFMMYYSWVISDILFLLINSTFNPFIYWCRIRRFRECVSREILKTQKTDTGYEQGQPVRHRKTSCRKSQISESEPL